MRSFDARALLIACSAIAMAACHARTAPNAISPPRAQVLRDWVENEVVSADSIRIERLQLGALAPLTDTLRFEITNQSRTPRIVAVSVRFEPGLWLFGNWQRAYAIPLASGERRAVALPYSVRRLSTDGRLLLTVGSPSGDSTALGVVAPIIERQFAIGIGNPAAVNIRANFEYLSTAHFDAYAYRGSLASHDEHRIVNERERAVQRVSELLGVPFRRRVTLVFYPDSATKRNETGHMGMGWATNDMIVEIYNEREKLDPYHELVHIVAGDLGNPPAALDEGLAVYASELLGADALEHLGHAGRTLDQATCDLINSGRGVPLDSLLRFSEFGSSKAPGDLLYPQGGSMVKYLIDTYGLDRFRDAYKTLQAGDASAPAALARILGTTAAGIETAWRAKLACAR